MIPVLYDENALVFTNMGICVLADATSVKVRRVLNGQDELEMKYPVSSEFFKELKNLRIILSVPEYKKGVQAYRIYRVSKPMNGFVTVNARHISERRMFTTVAPFTASTVQEAMSRIGTYVLDQSSPFTFYTDKTTVAPYSRSVPSSLGSVLGGSEGSFLDVFGGEYEFDMYQVRLLARRGIDRGVSVSYGKNLTNLEVIEAVDETVITSICPVWTGQDGESVYLPEYIIDSQYVSAYPFKRVIVVDFSADFDEQPSVSELRTAGQDYLTKNQIGVPVLTLKISFVHLAQFEEYKQFAVLETLNLGDTVKIHHTDLDVDITARIVETTFDVLNERYTNVVVGRVQTNMSGTLQTIEKSVNKTVKETKNLLSEAIVNVTDKITGANGGYVIQNFDQNGVPFEILIMDTPDKMTATNVLRINQNGIGFSKTGYNGPFTTGWTIDGQFVADFITSGTMSANRVRTGLITDVSGNNYWNLDTGEFVNRAITQRMDNMQDQIDDNVQTWSGADVPTLNNYPAVNWTTTAQKDNHVGDLYIISAGADEGTYYRFLKTGNVYEWKVLTDTEVQKALADAEEALRRISIAETQIEQNSEAIALRATKTEAQGYASTAQSNAATDATNKANAAVTSANNATDQKLQNYSTTSQMEAAIELSASGITQTVSATYETKNDATSKLNTAKTYAEGQAASAETNAKGYTDGALTNYSTTAQMNSAITQSAESITSTVSATYETKTDAASKLDTAETYADGKAATAESNANGYTDGKLVDYSTTTQMNSAISQSASSITQTVSATYETKTDATSKLNTAKTYADGKASAAESSANDYTDGKLIDYSTTTQMNSAIEQTASNITSTVSATYETKTDATSKLNTAKTYAEGQASAAEAAAVSAAAADATTKANAAETAANSATDNKLLNYSTTTQMNSAITQSASAITQSVAATYETKAEAAVLNLLPSVYARENVSGTTWTNNGVTWTVNPDGSVTVTGTATADSFYYFSGDALSAAVPPVVLDPAKKYRLSGGPSGGSDSTFRYAVRRFNADMQDIGYLYAYSGEVTIPAGCSYACVYVKISSGYAIPTGGLTFRPMLETGETTHGYVSTHGGMGAVARRVTSAEAALVVQAGQISSKVSETDYTGNTIASKINQNATTVQISASKINLQGAVTISSFDSTTQAALVTGTTTKMQYYLSTSSSSATGGSWKDTTPAWSSGKYVWTRIATTKTYASGTSNTTYSTAVYDANLTSALSTASGASTAATAAQTTANGNIKSSVSCYYRYYNNGQTPSQKPTIDSSTTIRNESYDTDNEWSYSMQMPKSGAYFYTCERQTLADNSVTFSAVRQLSNLTYASLWCSANNAAYIDGGHIYANSVTASQIAAGTITATEIASGTITATQIAANTITAAKIAANTITGAKIAARTITAAKIAAGAITATEIAANTITAAKIDLTDLFAQNITASNFNITGGSIKLTTNDTSYDVIELNYDGTSYIPPIVSKMKLTPVDLTIDATISQNNYRTGFYRDGVFTIFTDTSNNRTVRSYYSSNGVETSDTANAVNLHIGTDVFAFYKSTNKYSALVWPDSNGAGRLILGDGTTQLWRTELTNSGLVFRSGSDVITASYANSVTAVTYTPNDTHSTPLTFDSTESAIYVRKWGIGGYLRLRLKLTNGASFGTGTDHVICTLPAAYRPRYNHEVQVPSSSGKTSCLVKVTTAGNVIIARYSNSDAWGNDWIRAEIPMDYVQ